MKKMNMTRNLSVRLFQLSLLGMCSIIVLPSFASAHEVHIYEINGVEYEIVIGSLNEPVIVDDKTGVELEIVRDGKLLVGAQDMLQVEMMAGAASRIDSFSPIYGTEGRYKTNFIATVPTTLQYRIFGELEGAPFDQTYTCNPVGHPASVEDTTHIPVSEGVVQIFTSGNFGCPQPKEAFGFPEAAASSYNLSAELIDVGETEVVETVVAEETDGPDLLVIAALLFALIGTILGILANTRQKTSSVSNVA